MPRVIQAVTITVKMLGEDVLINYAIP